MAGDLWTWDRARQAGHPAAKDFSEKPPGMRVCESVNFDGGTTSVEPPVVDGESCWAPPSAGLFFVPPAQSAGNARYQDYGSGVGYRLGGSETLFASFEGAQNLAEISNPSVCHTCPTEHFYSRIAAITPASNGFEIGWVETNHFPATGNAQFVMTVTAPFGQPQSPVLDTRWSVVPGTERAFRGLQCGGNGVNRVCMEVWDGVQWVNSRTWSGVMACEKANGDGNCRFNWFSEVLNTDGIFFDINGGPDFLRTRNIHVQFQEGWHLFSPPSFSGAWRQDPTPYDICTDSTWHHFRFLRGTC